ncbi:uncharacterized protein isoform X2 [Leptinotarsa decemlineata]|uniref:uncharacterized protein isoform X2 n=1 Tax=Leptinotarsa decemlineata TaxID=7539 RepID=UPI003D30859E
MSRCRSTELHSNKTGRGLINSLINNLPFELHLPGYQYCGPGTKLQKRLLRGDSGVNQLDFACKKHDIAYSQNPDNLAARHIADKELAESAWNRVKAKDATIGEKGAAWLVTNIMKGKRRFGMGCDSSSKQSHIPKKKRSIKKKKVEKILKASKVIAFGSGIVQKVRDVLHKAGGSEFVVKNSKRAAEIALKAARKCMRAAGGKKKIRTPRIIPIPKIGGILPLIPIFAGLSALGSLAGATAGITKAVQAAKASREQLSETNRHNKHMEAIAIGKQGSGIYLKPYRKGLGVYLKPQNSKNS